MSGVETPGGLHAALGTRGPRGHRRHLGGYRRRLVTGGPPAGGSSAYGSPPPGRGRRGRAGRLAGPVEPPSQAAPSDRGGVPRAARVRRAPVHAHGLWGVSPRSPPAPSAAGDLAGVLPELALRFPQGRRERGATPRPWPRPLARTAAGAAATPRSLTRGSPRRSGSCSACGSQATSSSPTSASRPRSTWSGRVPRRCRRQGRGRREEEEGGGGAED